MVLLCVFFLQAEDGIRDLVRSRGLGDVYKRQDHNQVAALGCGHAPSGRVVPADRGRRGGGADAGAGGGAGAVSYTHLTLPTSDLV